MVKTTLGFLLGCFVTYNYIVGDPVLEPVIKKSNIWLLESVQNIEKKLQNNIDKE
tara:strand:+ start:1301 stop:1465 length:165 start_codon:yes stop_codon:yes gene_type:complete